MRSSGIIAPGLSCEPPVYEGKSWMYRSPKSDCGTTAALTFDGILMSGSVTWNVTMTPPRALVTVATWPTATPSTRTFTAGNTWMALVNSAL